MNCRTRADPNPALISEAVQKSQAGNLISHLCRLRCWVETVPFRPDAPEPHAFGTSGFRGKKRIRRLRLPGAHAKRQLRSYCLKSWYAVCTLRISLASAYVRPQLGKRQCTGGTQLHDAVMIVAVKLPPAFVLEKTHHHSAQVSGEVRPTEVAS